MPWRMLCVDTHTGKHEPMLVGWADSLSADTPEAAEALYRKHLKFHSGHRVVHGDTLRHGGIRLFGLDGRAAVVWDEGDPHVTMESLTILARLPSWQERPPIPVSTEAQRLIDLIKVDHRAALSADLSTLSDRDAALVVVTAKLAMMQRYGTRADARDLCAWSRALTHTGGRVREARHALEHEATLYERSKPLL